MKKIYYIFLVLILSSFIISVKAQVGINTQSVLGPFHIDSKGNNTTSASTKYDDDIIISTIGNLGVGTISPTAKLHIRTNASTPFLQLQDGNEQIGRVLLSNNIGEATWGILSIGNAFVTWKAHHSAFDFIVAGSNFRGESLSDISFNSKVENTSYDIESVTLPKGRYLIYVRGDIPAYSEYVYAVLRGYYASAPTTPVNIGDMLYEHTLSSMQYYEFTETIQLKLYIRMMNSINNMRAGYNPPDGGFVNPPATLSAWYEIALQKLD